MKKINVEKLIDDATEKVLDSLDKRATKISWYKVCNVVIILLKFLLLVGFSLLWVPVVAFVTLYLYNKKYRSKKPIFKRYKKP